MYLIFFLNSSVLVSSLTVVLSMALKKNFLNDSNEYWYICSITDNWITKKYNIAPSAATILYNSLCWLISASVILAIALYSEIWFDVYLVLSKFLINSTLSRMVAGSASDKDINNPSSNLSNCTENSFCYLTNSDLFISNSFLSILTTSANSYSSRPDSVTMKLMIVH